eukprot:5464987-Karenia_brevis.AAC.1
MGGTPHSSTRWYSSECSSAGSVEIRGLTWDLNTVEVAPTKISNKYQVSTPEEDEDDDEDG